MADLYYIEEGYYDAGYFVYTADAAAAVSATSSILAVGSANQVTDIVAFANASVTTVASKIVDVNDAYPYTWDDLTSWENFVTNEWRPSGIIVVSAFTLTGELNQLPIQASANLDSQASLSISIERFAGVASDLSSQINQSTVISKTASASSEMSSSFTQTATISHIEGADLFAFSEAAIAVQVDRIRENNIEASIAFNVATSVERIQQGDADADAIFSAIVNGLRSRDVNLETQAAFSFDSTGDKIRFLESAISSEAILYCDATEITPFIQCEASVASEFAVQADCGKILQYQSAISSTVTLTATISHIEGADLFAFSQSALSATAERTRDNQANVSDAFSTQATATRIQQAQSDISSQATVNSVVNASREFNASIQSTVEVTATISHIEGADLTAFSNANLSVVIDKFVQAEIAVNIEFNQSAVNERSRATSIDAQTAFSFVVDFEKFRPFEASLTATAEISCIISHIEGADIVVQNFASVSVSAVKQTQSSVSLNSTFQQNTNAGFRELGAAQLRAFSSIFVSRNVGETGRPRNLVDNFVNGLPSFNSSIKKFGTHSLSGGVNLNFGNNGQNNFIIPFQNQDFYLETWHYPTTTTNQNIIWITNFFAIQRSNTGFFRFEGYFADPNNSSGILISYRYTHNVAYSLNQWHHLAVVKQGNSIAYYINGTRVNFYGYPTTTSDPNEPVPLYRWGSNANTTYAGTIQVLNTGNGLTDEAFYVRGSTYGYSTSSTTITVPTQARTNDTNVEFLYHFDNNVNDDVSLVQTGQANIQSQALVTARLSGTSNGSANLSSTATLTATISHIEGADLTAFTDASVSVIVDKIIQTEANANVEFSLSADVNTISDALSNQEMLVNVSAINDRIRDVEIQTDSVASSLSAVGRIADFFINADVVSVVDAIGNRTAEGGANLDTQSALGIVVEIFRDTQSNLVLTTEIVANNQRLRDNNIELVGSVAVEASISKVVQLSSNQNSNFVVVCDPSGGTIRAIALVMSAGTLIVDAQKSVDISLALENEFVSVINTQDSLNKIGNANISSEFNLLANVNYTVDNVIITEAVASNLTVVVKTVAVAIPLDSNSTISADVSRIRSSQLTASATSAITVTISKITTFDSAITSAFTQTSVAGIKADAVIVTQAIASNLTAVVRVAGLLITSNVVSTLTVSGIVVRSAQSAFTSTATLASAPIKQSQGSAAISSTGSLSAVVGVRKQFNSNFTSALTFVVAIRDLRLDEIVYVIPGENYVYQIISESRLHDIYGETRIRSITGETRIRTITGESRIHIID